MTDDPGEAECAASLASHLMVGLGLAITVEEAREHLASLDFGQRIELVERLRLLQRARAQGLDMSPPTVTPEQIIEAVNAPPAATLTITDETTDEETSRFIRGER
jgi:hypothetical protein